MEPAKEIVNLFVEIINDDYKFRDRWEEMTNEQREETLYFLKDKIRTILEPK